MLAGDEREVEASEARRPSREGSNLLEVGTSSPLSDAQILEENEPYFEYIEAVTGRKLSEQDRADYVAYARAKKVQLDPGSRLGIVTLPGRTPQASEE